MVEESNDTLSNGEILGSTPIISSSVGPNSSPNASAFRNVVINAPDVPVSNVPTFRNIVINAPSVPAFHLPTVDPDLVGRVPMILRRVPEPNYLRRRLNAEHARIMELVERGAFPPCRAGHHALVPWGRRYTDPGCPLSIEYRRLFLSGYVEPVAPNPTHPELSPRDACLYHHMLGHNADECVSWLNRYQDLIEFGIIVDPDYGVRVRHFA